MPNHSSRTLRRLLAPLSAALVITVLVLSPAAWRAQAQGGLSDDEQALFDRASAVVDRLLAYETLAFEGNETNTNQIELTQGDSFLRLRDVTQQAIRETRVRDGENRNIRALIQADTVESDSRSFDVNFSLDVEVRYVDDVLYVQATTDAADEDALPPVPEGWIIWDDAAAEAYPDLDNLSPDTFLEPLGETGIFSYFDRLPEYAASVTLESIVMGDGRAADRLTIEVLGSNVGAIFQQVARDEDEAQNVIDVFGLVSDTSTMTISFLLGPDDALFGFEGHIYTKWDDLDLNLLNPEAPPNTATVNWIIETRVFQMITAFNEPLEATTAPAIGE